MEDLRRLYAEAAHAAEEQWVRELIGTDQPVTPREREQALGELFDRWASPPESAE
ncbi:hypothetical protein [Nocardiopsis dassonvillei]|uniref:hypothetical protein n=1 Tax=Nocardiopsis dassonvillei TaxID=2014 RepID=UPI00340EB619